MSRLGRNPFEKKLKTEEPRKPLRAIDVVREPALTKEELKGPKKRKFRKLPLNLAEFFIVDLRAESYLLGLKIYLLSTSLFE